MPFTEQQLNALLDPGATGRTITLQRINIGAATTDIVTVGVLAPYAGRTRSVQLLSSLTPAQAVTAIQSKLTE